MPGRVLSLVAAALAMAAALLAQPHDSQLVVIDKTGRHTVPLHVVDGQDMVAVDDLDALFPLTLREDARSSAITLTAGARTLVYSAQGLASSSGKLVQFASGPRKERARWYVPSEFLGRGLSLILDQRLEYRRPSRLLLVGDVHVPRVVVRSDVTPTSARVTIDTSPRTSHTLTQDAGRLVVAMAADALDVDLVAPGASELLTGISRVESPPAIALTTGPRFATYRTTDIAVDGSTSRTVIELLPAGGDTAAAPTAAAATPSPLPFDAASTGVRTIVVDAGHGGDELGARGPAGTLEKDVTLAVARRLRALLETRLGVRVLMTRDEDKTIGLDERAALANNHQADLFVSIHANASVASSASGAEVFYLSLDEYGERSRREATPTSTSVPSVSGDRSIELVLWDMAQARHLADSAVLAGYIEQQLRTRVAMSPRAIQQAPFRVLVGANMPAVLVEMGFVTNPAEEARLVTATHQAAVAQALFDSIVQFTRYVEGGRTASTPPSPTGRGR